MSRCFPARNEVAIKWRKKSRFLEALKIFGNSIQELFIPLIRCSLVGMTTTCVATALGCIVVETDPKKAIPISIICHFVTGLFAVICVGIVECTKDQVANLRRG